MDRCTWCTHGSSGSVYYGAPPIPTKKILSVFKNANEDRVLRSSEFKKTNQDPKKSSSAVGIPESSVFSDEYHEITCQNSAFLDFCRKKILVRFSFFGRRNLKIHLIPTFSSVGFGVHGNGGAPQYFLYSVLYNTTVLIIVDNSISIFISVKRKKFLSYV